MSTDLIPNTGSVPLRAAETGLTREECVKVGVVLKLVDYRLELHGEMLSVVELLLGEFAFDEVMNAIPSASSRKPDVRLTPGMVRAEAVRLSGLKAPDPAPAMDRAYRWKCASENSPQYGRDAAPYEHPAVRELADTETGRRLLAAKEDSTTHAQVRDVYLSIACRHDDALLDRGGVNAARRREEAERAGAAARLAEIDAIEKGWDKVWESGHALPDNYRRWFVMLRGVEKRRRALTLAAAKIPGLVVELPPTTADVVLFPRQASELSPADGGRYLDASPSLEEDEWCAF